MVGYSNGTYNASSGIITYKVTATVCGLLEALTSEIVRLQVYLPTGRPDISTFKLTSSTSPVELPLFGSTESQSQSSLMCQLRVLWPLLDMPSIWTFGFAPPSRAVDRNCVSESSISGPPVLTLHTLPFCRLGS